MTQQIDFANMTLEEIQKVVALANAAKRDKKAKARRKKLVGVFEPLFQVIDKAVEESPALTKHLSEQNALRLYFNDEQKVNRETFRSYAEGNKSGNGRGTRSSLTVWHNKDGQWHEYPSMRALANAYGIPNTGASARTDLKKHQIDFAEEAPVGVDITPYATK